MTAAEVAARRGRSARTCCWSLGEITLTHPTAHAHLAAAAMTRGRYARLLLAGLGAGRRRGRRAVDRAWRPRPLALAGLLAYEHAYVQAGQSVPLA